MSTEKQDVELTSRPLGAQPITPSGRIVFQEDARPTRADRASRADLDGPPLRRSQSRDSIRSVHERRRSVSGVPIEFRTLSFRVADSQARSFEKGGVDLKRTKTDATVEKLQNTDYHKISLHELYLRLRTSAEQGLSQHSAALRLKESGKNTLPRQPTNYLKKILRYVFGGFCSVLWVGVIIFFICWRPLGDPDPAPYNLGLAVLVLIVIFLQALFSAFQDYSTAKTMNSILDMVPSESLVLRDGSFVHVATADLVPGDIVRISIGNKVPADMRLIETSGDIRFDRAALTGESEEVDGVVEQTDDNFLETKNIALMGTVVTNGSATGIIVFTGVKTVMGGIAVATTSVKEEDTAIQKEITRFVIIICGLTAILASIILITWAAWLRVDHFEYINVIAMLDDVMGCVVAFIPEGMPVAVALTLLMIAKRMKAVNVLPKSLATVETLGCVNVICSDKTGTLTENKMTVTSVGFVDESFKIGQEPARFAATLQSNAVGEIVRAAHLCNDAAFDPLTLDRAINDRLTQGNATDGAVLRFAEAARPGSEVSAEFRQVAQIPFNSKNKLMLTLNKSTIDTDETKPLLAIMKGGPDVLLPKCTKYWSFKEQQVKILDAQAKQDLIDLQVKLSNNAERVILICERHYTPKAAIGSSDLAIELLDECIEDLTIVGLLGIFDPPRPESANTVADCRRAGLRFFMMTGDFGLTGAAIARQIGIFSPDARPHTIDNVKSKANSAPSQASDEKSKGKKHQPEIVIDQGSSLLLEGSQISSLVDEDWDVVCAYEEIVFGRCIPEHKLRIIDELKKRGFCTAVTGDGVNDAPALKAADVGIAMVQGSDVALEAADLILLGGFDSIVEAIRLGRLVFQNLQKVISYLLPAGSWSEIWPVLLNVFLGVPLPLSSFLMIIICVFTDLFLSLALIMEKEEFDLLSVPPRRAKKDHLINLKIYAQSYLFIGMMEAIIAHSMFFLYYWRYAGIPASALFLSFEAYSDGFYGYSQDELNNFNIIGQSVYFVTLVILQWGNILSIRNKRLSIVQADPIRKQRRNPWLIPAALISLVIAIFVTEEPGLQNLFGTGSVPIEFWFIPIPLALGILFMDEIRKVLVRSFPKGPIARIAW